MKFDMVPFVSLDFKLRELFKAGFISQTPIYREGWGRGHYWSIENRKIRIISGFVGSPQWNFQNNQKIQFQMPHDLAIDEKNNSILAFAPT